MTDLPEPLTPPDCDLRSFDWCPFYHKRLLQSAFWSRASDQACRISVDFWSRSYEQVPAASLPDDDFLLAEWAGFGRRNVTSWTAVKAEVMEPWVRCSDGRWYHPTLSEVACKAWVERRLHLWKRECERLRKENAKRAKTGLESLEMPGRPSDDPFVAVKSVKIEAISVGGSDVPSDGTTRFSGGKDQSSTGTCAFSELLPPETGPSTDGIPAENALKGKGRGRETEELDSFSLRSKETHASALQPKDAGQPRARPPRTHPFPPDAFERWYSGYPHKVGRAAAEKAFAKVRASDTVSFEQLVDGVASYRKTKPPDREWCNPSTWLNQARWADQPASSTRNEVPPAQGDEPRVDFGNGTSAPHATIRSTWDRGRWPTDWGPRPGEPGCLIPPETMAEIMGGERRAA